MTGRPETGESLTLSQAIGGVDIPRQPAGARRDSRLRVGVLGGGALGLAAALRLGQGGGGGARVARAGPLGGGAGGCPGGPRALEKFYHHIFRTDTTFVRFAGEVGLAGRLQWLHPDTSVLWQGRRASLDSPADVLRFPFLPPLTACAWPPAWPCSRPSQTSARSPARRRKPGSAGGWARGCTKYCGAPSSTASLAPVPKRSP